MYRTLHKQGHCAFHQTYAGTIYSHMVTRHTYVRIWNKLRIGRVPLPVKSNCFTLPCERDTAHTQPGVVVEDDVQ